MRISMMKRALRLAVLAACAALLPLAAAAQDRPVSVRGHVVDAASGEAVPGAAVSISGARRRAYTDRTGTFTVSDVPPGSQTISVSQLGYAVVEQALTVPTGDSLTVRMHADPLVLQGVTAQVDRLEYRRIHSTMASAVYDQRRIATFGHPDPVDFLRYQANLRISRCNDRDLYGGPTAPGDCVMSRGTPERMLLVIDEQPERGGVAMLEHIPLQDIYRIEVYEGGTIVLVYTKHFMQAAMRANRQLLPLTAFKRMTEAASPNTAPLTNPDPQ
jgi:hypothetical protein